MTDLLKQRLFLAQSSYAPPKQQLEETLCSNDFLSLLAKEIYQVMAATLDVLKGHIFQAFLHFCQKLVTNQQIKAKLRPRVFLRTDQEV